MFSLVCNTRNRFKEARSVIFMYFLILDFCLKTYIPVYSTSLDKGLSTRKPVEWQRLTPHAEVHVRDYLSTGKYYLPTIIKLQVYYPLGASCIDMLITSLREPFDIWTILHHQGSLIQ